MELKSRWCSLFVQLINYLLEVKRLDNCIFLAFEPGFICKVMIYFADNCGGLALIIDCWFPYKKFVCQMIVSCIL